MPLDRAALIGCSVMTGVGAVINTAAVPPGASMAVFGVGGVGLNVVQGGALVAAHPVIAVDVKAAKLEHARALGASHLVDASREDAVAAIRRITRLGADYTFVAVGDTPGGEPGHRGAGARRHLRADRRARDRRHACRSTCGRW